MSKVHRVYWTDNYNLLVDKKNIYYESGDVLLSIGIHDTTATVTHHSSSEHRLPDSARRNMLVYQQQLLQNRQEVILGNLKQRRIEMYNIGTQYVEYLTRTIHPTKGLVVVYDFYRVELVNGFWDLREPYYWKKGVVSKQEQGVFKLYDPNGEKPYFKVDGIRKYLSDFQKLT